MYHGSYEFIPTAGPLKGRRVFLPRRYDAFEIKKSDKGWWCTGCYIWIDKQESYEWQNNLTLAEYRRMSGSKNVEPPH